MKRYPLLSVASVLVFLLASAGAASAQQKLAGGPITVGILLLNKPYITEFAGPLRRDARRPVEHELRQQQKSSDGGRPL